jgi:hypothetical protein
MISDQKEVIINCKSIQVAFKLAFQKFDTHCPIKNLIDLQLDREG